MKRYISLIPILLLFVFSCKKNDGNPADGDPQPVGVPTEVGVPNGGASIEKNIGADGGSVTSRDGRLKINIPSGALTSSQTISIQPISNFNPLALGDAYRLEPHGIKFAKPVTIEFHYDEEDIQNTIPEALGIAYQDSTGIWQARGGVEIDKTNNTIKVITDHFSDWSLFESIHLTTSGTVAPVGSTIQLQVSAIEDLVIPLDNSKEAPLGKKVSVAAKYVKEWRLHGAGKLEGNTSNAVYTAPSRVPSSPNPVTVSVVLKFRQQTDEFILSRQIEIIEDNGEIQVRLAGSSWVTKPATPAVKDANGFWLLADADGDTQGSYVLIVVPDALGTHAYRSPYVNIGTYVHYLVTAGDSYVCQYTEGDRIFASGGGISVTNLGEEDGFITGTFTTTPAGYGDQLQGKINMEGKFRVRKATLQ